MTPFMFNRPRQTRPLRRAFLRPLEARPKGLAYHFGSISDPTRFGRRSHGTGGRLPRAGRDPGQPAADEPASRRHAPGSGRGHQSDRSVVQGARPGLHPGKGAVLLQSGVLIPGPGQPGQGLRHSRLHLAAAGQWRSVRRQLDRQLLWRPIGAAAASGTVQRLPGQPERRYCRASRVAPWCIDQQW